MMSKGERKMNLKKSITVFITIIMMVIFMGIPCMVFAAPLPLEEYGLLPLREDNKPYMGYSIDGRFHTIVEFC